MTDHTPEPCGCHPDGPWGHIVYCPTHAAAFETVDELKAWKQGLHRSDVEQKYISRLQYENAALLMALERLRRDYKKMSRVQIEQTIDRAVGAQLQKDVEL